MAKPKKPVRTKSLSGKNFSAKDISNMDSTGVSDPEKDKLEDFKSKFKQAYAHEKEWRKEKEEYGKFYDGDQLSDEEKKTLEGRGQPRVVVNRIKPKIDSILGIERSSQVMTKAFPRGDTDEQKAKYITETFRYIEYQTQFEREESLAFEDAIIDGRGWYKHEIKFDDLEAEMHTYRVDNDDIFKDPYSKKEDLSDCKFLFESIWADLDDAQELFPKYEEELKELVDKQDKGSNSFDSVLRQQRPDQYQQKGNDTPVMADDIVNTDDLFVDRERKRVRLITIWYKQPYKRTFMFHSDTNVKDITGASAADLKKYSEMFPGFTMFDEVKYKLNTATFTSESIMEEKFDIRKSGKYPFVEVPAYLKRGRDKLPYGYVKQMIDPQKEINKRRSKMLHLLNTNQIIYEKGAIDNPTITKGEVARPDGLIEVNPQFKFEIKNNTELSSGQFQLLQEAKTEIDDAGVNRELQGLQSNASSGRAIALRQQQASVIIKPLFDNLRMARQRVASLWLEDIQEYWNTQKLIKITDDIGVTKTIILNEKTIDPETGQEVILNDVSLGKYDIIVEEVQDTINLQSEQFDALINLAKSGVQIPPDILIEASSLPNKADLIDRIQKAMEQQAQMVQALQAQHAQQKAGGSTADRLPLPSQLPGGAAPQ